MYVPATVFIIDVRNFQPFSALFNMSLTQFSLRLNGIQVSREQHKDVFIFLSYFCSGGRIFPCPEWKQDFTFPSVISRQKSRNHPWFLPSLTPCFQPTHHQVLVVLLPKYILSLTASLHFHTYHSCLCLEYCNKFCIRNAFSSKQQKTHLW